MGGQGFFERLARSAVSTLIFFVILFFPLFIVFPVYVAGLGLRVWPYTFFAGMFPAGALLEAGLAWLAMDEVKERDKLLERLGKQTVRSLLYGFFSLIFGFGAAYDSEGKEEMALEIAAMAVCCSVLWLAIMAGVFTFLFVGLGG